MASADVPSEEAVFFNLGAIALQGVRKARIELGEATLVLGQGLIGLLSLQLAKLSGALPIIAADLTDSRLELAKSIGADAILNPEDTDFSEQLNAVTNGNGPVVVIEATGHPDAVSTALDVAGWGRAPRTPRKHTRRDTEGELLSRCTQKRTYPLRRTQRRASASRVLSELLDA